MLQLDRVRPVSYTHLRAHETVLDLVCRLLLEKKKISLPMSVHLHLITIIHLYATTRPSLLSLKLMSWIVTE
ncbi:hypothetical protein PVA38_11825 [Streptococcus pneumoniae D39]|nr:hypothetical protein PVA38_11825 [Streptococcus pneumoniae D39]